MSTFENKNGLRMACGLRYRMPWRSEFDSRVRALISGVKIRFLADANLDQDIVLGLWRREPLVDFELPRQFIPDGTPDPIVLAIAAQRNAVLVTHDIRTMPRHFGEFLETSTSPGLFWCHTKQASLSRLTSCS